MQAVDDALSESLDRGPGRSGPDRTAPQADGPIRRCLATGARKPQAEMIRFVLAPDGTVTPDLAAKLPGRGMWLSADAGSIKTACARKLFAKAARAKAVAEADLPARVETLLAARCVETLSLARRAGVAVTGFEKVRAALERGEAALLVEARDAAADGRRKLAQARKGRDLPVVSALTADEIGAAFGRERAVYAALKPGGLMEKLRRDAGRLAGFRANGPTDDDAGTSRRMVDDEG
jgi:hypothetical protein